MGPEVVMQMVEERAPGGFKLLGDVVTQRELEEVSASYKVIAEFDRGSLNRADRPIAPGGNIADAGVTNQETVRDSA